MRVALFTESFFPVVNGVSVSVRTLAENLRSAGHEVLIVAPRFPGHHDSPQSVTGSAADSLPIVRVPSWRTPLNPQNPFAYPPGLTSLRTLHEWKPDIVHTHHPFGIGLQGAKLARERRIPLISTFHTLYTEYSHYVPLLPAGWVASVVRRYLRFYYERCQFVIVPSNESGRRLGETGLPTERLRRVPTGVPDASAVSEEAIRLARRRFDLPEGCPVVLFVGRLAREKNPDLLLAAFAALRNLPHCLLVLAGDGPFRSDVERAIERLALRSRVRLTGFLTFGELAPLYSLASVFAFPSSSETQGVVLCEAMSYGLPCVAVRGGGAPEFLRDGIDGRLVDPSPEPFAAALTEILVDLPLRARFSEAARNTPLRLTPEQMTTEMLRLYSEAQDRTQQKGEPR
ncbi:MAG: glycosyltransferase [Capsulimonadales bacterium]|nr:glycosyltransferase [Capsulimonadales bacterium]